MAFAARRWQRKPSWHRPAATPSRQFRPGCVSAGGPRISHVYRQSATQYVLTIIHDTGTDLIVPQQAANGVGFALMDGGPVASPGNRIFASACARVDATHLLVTLPSAPSNAASDCLFFYPYGGFRTGSGNAVTDNASTVTPPAGWDIGNQLRQRVERQLSGRGDNLRSGDQHQPGISSRRH